MFTASINPLLVLLSYGHGGNPYLTLGGGCVSPLTGWSRCGGDLGEISVTTRQRDILTTCQCYNTGNVVVVIAKSQCGGISVTRQKSTLRYRETSATMRNLDDNARSRRQRCSARCWWKTHNLTTWEQGYLTTWQTWHRDHLTMGQPINVTTWQIWHWDNLTTRKHDDGTTWEWNNLTTRQTDNMTIWQQNN